MFYALESRDGHRANPTSLQRRELAFALPRVNHKLQRNLFTIHTLVRHAAQTPGRRLGKLTPCARVRHPAQLGSEWIETFWGPAAANGRICSDIMHRRRRCWRHPPPSPSKLIKSTPVLIVFIRTHTRRHLATDTHHHHHALASAKQIGHRATPD